jgi:hypothetical protein
MGVVEVDETWVGGKDKNRHWDRRSGSSGGKGTGKAAVIGAVQRKGNVVARVIEDVDANEVAHFLRETLSHKVSLVATDEARHYAGMHVAYPHGSVCHGAGEYVAGVIHTNTIEGFWSLLKRGIMGTFHKVSHKYLPLYVAEFQFRYNNRLNPNIFGEAIKGC